MTWRDATTLCYNRLGDPGSPCNQRSTCIIRVPVAVASPVAHSMVGRKDKCSFPVVVKVLNKFRDFLDSFINNFEIFEIFFRVWSVAMSRSVQSEEVQKEYILIL